MSPIRPLLCGLFFSCAASEDGACPSSRGEGAAFTELLEAVQASPEDAENLCAALSDPLLHRECIEIGAETIAADNPEKARALCESIEASLEQDECFFQVAERSHQPELCGLAGRFQEDCRMHTWSRVLAGSLTKGSLPGQVEDTVSDLITPHGFDMDDPRPWVALYRMLLGQMKPMQRAVCAEIEDKMREEICQSTGLALFHDRLNYLRDKALFPCAGGPLPPELNTQLDPELEQAIDERKALDLCP